MKRNREPSSSSSQGLSTGREPVVGVITKIHPDNYDIYLADFTRDRNRLMPLFRSAPTGRIRPHGALFNDAVIENLPDRRKSVFAQMGKGDRVELIELKLASSKNNRWHIARGRYLQPEDERKFSNCLGIVYTPMDSAAAYAFIRSPMLPKWKDAKTDLHRFDRRKVNTGDIVTFDAVQSERTGLIDGVTAHILSGSEAMAMHRNATETVCGDSPMYTLWNCLLYSELREQSLQCQGVIPCQVRFTELKEVPLQGRLEVTCAESSAADSGQQPTPNWKLKKGDAVTIRTNTDSVRRSEISSLKVVVTSTRQDGDLLRVNFASVVNPDMIGHFLHKQAYLPDWFHTLELTADTDNIDRILFPIRQGTLFGGGVIKQQIVKSLRSVEKYPLVEPVEPPPATKYVLRLGQEEFIANAQQTKIAYNVAICTQPLVTVSGPPGTSKTVTIALAVREYLQQKPEGRVLVTAPSNTAVDRIGDIFCQMPPDPAVRPLRILTKNKEMRCYSSCSSICLHERVHDVLEGVTDLTADDHLRALVEAYNLVRAEVAELQTEMLDEGLTGDQLTALDHKYRDKLTDQLTCRGRIVFAVQAAINPNVILSTCASSSDERVLWNTKDAGGFTLAIIDEGGQATDIEAFLVSSLLSGGQCDGLMLVGDIKQLPPTTLTGGESAVWIGTSILEKLIRDGISVPYLLEDCYRCHPGLLEFLNKRTYDNRLRSAVSAEQRSLLDLDLTLPEYFANVKVPVLFTDVKGTTAVTHFLSKYNILEADCVADMCALLSGANQPLSRHIVVMTPYEAQKQCIVRQLRQAGITTDEAQVSTVDGCQASECEFTVLSLVRSGFDPDLVKPEEDSDTLCKRFLGFVSDERRAVVALSRARRGIIIIGNKDTLKLSSYWNDYLAYYEGLSNPYYIIYPDNTP